MDGLRCIVKHCLMKRRVLLDRYHIEDIAMKVVGVGSVGTLCAVVLLMAEDDDPLLLQVKEASPSVLAPYAGKSEFDHQGERIVVGQRLMQSASDMMLGWVTGSGKYKIQLYILESPGYELRPGLGAVRYAAHQMSAWFLQSRYHTVQSQYLHFPVLPVMSEVPVQAVIRSSRVWRCCNDLIGYMREIHL